MSFSAAKWVVNTINQKMKGPKGRIAALEKLTIEQFESLKKSDVGKHIQDYTVIGGMVAFTPFRGTLDDVKKLLFKLFDRGVIAFFCGHGPYRVRMLPPFGVMTDAQWKEVFKIIHDCTKETAEELKL